LADGLRLDPLGQLKRAPDPLAAKRGPTSKGRDGKGLGGEGREGNGGGGGKEGKGRGKEREGTPQVLVDTPHVPNPEKKTLYISAIHGGPLRPNS